MSLIKYKAKQAIFFVFIYTFYNNFLNNAIQPPSLDLAYMWASIHGVEISTQETLKKLKNKIHLIPTTLLLECKMQNSKKQDWGKLMWSFKMQN